MDIIKIKLNQRLHQMVEEVVEEYQLSPNEIILNTLNHFIKDKKDFLVGRQFELQAIVRQKQLEYEKAEKALELHNATIANFEKQTEPTSIVTPVKESENKIYMRTGKRGKQQFEFTDENVKAFKDQPQSYYYDTKVDSLKLTFNKNNKKTFYSVHQNIKIQRASITIWLGKAEDLDVATARKMAQKNESLVRQGIHPTKDVQQVSEKTNPPPEVDANGFVMWREFAPYKYTELDILGIALEDNKINIEQCKRKFQNGIYKDTAKQAFAMWKNDEMTIGDICKVQPSYAGTHKEKDCTVSNMLLSRILKAIWHFGTEEEKNYIYKDGGKS